MRKWIAGLGIAGAMVALLVIASAVGWRLLVSHFQQRYYQENYEPLALAPQDLVDYPARYHLDDVPWIATREALCQANSLAMVAEQHGIEASTGRCSFLMGFTYGAVQVPGSQAINPFTDPEVGFVVAAPYLGLARRYYVTEDAQLYRDALRTFLSQDHAVRVALDAAVLYQLEGELPHSDLLVGYDEAGFYYYETVCLPEFRCEPGHRPPGEQGLWISDQMLLAAVARQADQFSYPWRYSLTIFDTRALADDLGAIWRRNGRALLGGAQYGPRQGADAIEGLAAEIERRGVQIEVEEVRWGLEAAVDTRRSNAAYLRTAYASQADLEQAAELFHGAAEAYSQALASLGDGIRDQAEAEQIAGWLRDAAKAERAAGAIFLARGG